MTRFHKVQTHRWINGSLTSAWDFFEQFEDAILYAESQTDAHVIKIYTDSDELVHSIQPTVTDTYA